MKNDSGCVDSVHFKRHKIPDRLVRSAVVGLLIFFWVAAVTVFVITACAGNVIRGENIADAAEQLLSEIRETHYQHKTHVIQSAGIYDMDCSGFVDFLLKRVAPGQYAGLPIEPGRARPRAAMYFKLFSGLPAHDVPGWRAIDQTLACQTG